MSKKIINNHSGKTQTKQIDPRTILERWNITIEELTLLVDENASLKGLMSGYIAEFQLREILCTDPRITHYEKPLDHNRDEKYDLIITYRGHSFRIEVKSLQSNSIKDKEERPFSGTFQCDASDRRTIILPSGRLETTCLLVGGFDMIAVSLFSFQEKWDFAFALNRDLPRSTFRKYTQEQQQYLISSSIKITWPPQPPFTANPFDLLDILVEERNEGVISL